MSEPYRQTMVEFLFSGPRVTTSPAAVMRLAADFIEKNDESLGLQDVVVARNMDDGWSVSIYAHTFGTLRKEKEG